MELKVYFENKFVLLTDGKGTKKIENFRVCNNKSDMQAAIRAITQSNGDSVVVQNDNFDTLMELFKAEFTYIEAAGGFIENEDGEYLFIFRREKWDLPKGKLEVGETPEIAAVREVQEETGLMDVTRTGYRCSTWHTYELHGKQILKQTYWYNMKAPKNQSSKPQTEEEITELQWIAPSNFKEISQNTFPSIICVINNE
ncbi:MAG: NUDIX domain-containing protein [Bacteroidales bacterium]|nr:NUDIX domain-containing protein [Bacteroidales bacterium]